MRQRGLKMKPNSRKLLLMSLTVGLCLAGGLLVVGSAIGRWRAPVHSLWDQARIGTTEAEVIRLLGKPQQVFESGTAPEDYYVSGYARRERAITGKVLIYRGADMVLYVWIDPQGKVEETFRGVS